MKNAVKYGTQKYLVDKRKIYEIEFNYREINSEIRVRYAGSKYSEHAFFVNFVDGKPDHRTESELYIAIMSVNRGLIGAAA